MTYIAIEPSGKRTVHEGTPSLDEAQALCGGYVEAHTLRRGSEYAVLLVGEDAKMQGQPPNPYVTRLAVDHGVRLRPGDGFVGTAVVIGPADDEGDWTGLGPEWTAHLTP